MKVKTCPFCGGKPYVEQSQRGFIDGESTKVCFVRCRKCNARSPRVNIKDFGKSSRSFEAINYVVDLWNRRVDTVSEVEFNNKGKIRNEETLVLRPLYMETTAAEDSELIL